ncbi:RNA recognition motif (RRM) domain [Geosmithia morbida]|uniref:RNA recognition motif (RRM) domain n=1 Tax=Geosmithia morbida TaxID=1094350 RepID=A0A9P4Z1U5_9HYPO|nr:RNA recognition motif (RRM) domain [Geosmithia morbida]KAF4126597.1 RNA recognition motif (RRM) domain [Geosmithia morbida]
MEGNHGGFVSAGNPRNRNHHGPVPTGPVNTADPNGLVNTFGGMALNGMNVPTNPGTIPLGWFVDNGYPAGLNAMHHNIAMVHNDGPYAQIQGHTHGYPGAFFGLQMPISGLPPYTPGRRNMAQPRAHRGQSDVPSLENRRGSYSTNESTPATPFWAGVPNRENAPRVASLDRSAYTTPSPQQLGMSAIHGDPTKPVTSAVSDTALDALLQQDPPVPKAVPAVFTPPGQMKTVDQSLENRIPGNRNVYIRGLHPTTDDELLYQFAARFGAVETSKAIIDTATGACKGVRDSEMCIRGFHRLGYEVGFARESFNSRLKSQGDEGSTNLYISNLPKTLNEVELGTIFLGFTILSSKILRDSMGNSRGVGFARFESRDVCDEIISKFNGVGIGEEGLLMNIRYADTPAQKELKRVTAERRQFRTNEYNIGAYGTPLVGMSPNLLGRQSQWRHSGGPGRRTATTASTDPAGSVSTPTSSEFDEGVTIHAEQNPGVLASASAQSSPSGKKPVSKRKDIRL